MSDATKQDFYTIFVNRQTYFGMPVSIHAPAWGATKTKSIVLILIRFQSTHPRGVRPLAVSYKGGISIFQSTHPRGVRHRGLCISGPQARFQSTHPRGVRPIAAQPSATPCVFQSTHPRGVRPFVPTAEVEDVAFQSTHPRGVRQTFAILTLRYRDFNPRTRVGCDSKSL